MGTKEDEALDQVLINSEKTIVQLKGLLEQIMTMRVEAAKLEFDMLTLYHTLCPDVLESLREDEQSVNIADKDGEENDSTGSEKNSYK